MNNNKEISKGAYYVFNLPQNLLNTLALKKSTTYNSHNISQEKETSTENTTTQPDNPIGAQACSLCKVTFINVEEQRDHIRSDLHCYNVKQKIQGRKVFTEREFEELVCDLSESISGSDISDIDEDSEDDDGGERRATTLDTLLKKQAVTKTDLNKPNEEDSEKQDQIAKKASLLLFESSTLPANTCLGIYRSLFTNIEQKSDSSILESLKKKQLTTISEVKNTPSSGNQISLQAENQPHFFLCMIGGGHFAGMIVSLVPKNKHFTTGEAFDKQVTIFAHKTFHRYTTRRKQGGAQSANDSAKGAAHSAGASLRRYNEQALTEEVRLLLQEWKNMIDSSELLFIRATGSTNRQTLFGPYKDQVLRPKDPRVRGFPFSTRRPTQKELLRSFIELTRVKYLEVTEPEINANLAASKVSAKVDKQTSLASSKISEEEATALLHTSQIQALIRRNRLSPLLAYLNNNRLSPDFRFHPFDSPQNYQAPTPLLLAAHINSAPLINGLLLKGNADPGVRNQNGKTAYELAGNRVSRQAFCIARFELGENKWNWEQTGIPSGISRDEAEAELRKEKEEEERKEQQRRKLELENLKIANPNPINENVSLGKAAMRGRMVTLGKVQKTAQEKREDEAKGLTPEMRMRLDRERRARAAEERMKKMADKS